MQFLSFRMHVPFPTRGPQKKCIAPARRRRSKSPVKKLTC